MPGTVPMLDDGAFSALRGGDENAFETLFRSRFQLMLETAQEQLHEPARAARAVERTFEIFWKEREHCDDAVAVETMLDVVLRDELARLQARAHANGRRAFGEHSKGPAVVHAAPSVDEAWARVRADLHPSVLKGEDAVRAQRQMRHAAAEHMAAIGKKRSPLATIAGVVLVAGAVGGILYYLQHRGGDRAIDLAFASADVREIASKAGQRGATTLSDETQVALGAATRLVIPPGYGTKIRAVKLDGTASFTVAPNKTLPFVVRTANADIEATGTAFDVSGFAGDPYVLVRVREGAVTVSRGKETKTVSAGEAYAIPSSGAMTAATPGQVEEGLSWINGELVVTNRSLKDVLPILQRWYDLVLTPENKTMLDRPVSLRAGLDSMRAAMRELQKNASVVIDYDGKRNLMRDVGGSSAK